LSEYHILSGSTPVVREQMRIEYLADHQDVIPILSAWFYQEWSYLYPERTEDEFRRLISERTNKDKIPLSLVSFEGDELVGTVCLKIHDMDTKPDLSPWLAGLYVKESWRRKGIGSTLVKAIERKALELGIHHLFLYTPESEHFYSHLGWKVRGKEFYHHVPVAIMEKDIIL
jgi:GNAT superfamily N-acetyltransferase